MSEARAQTILLGLTAIFAFIAAASAGFMAFVLLRVLGALQEFSAGLGAAGVG